MREDLGTSLAWTTEISFARKNAQATQFMPNEVSFLWVLRVMKIVATKAFGIF